VRDNVIAPRDNAFSMRDDVNPLRDIVVALAEHGFRLASYAESILQHSPRVVRPPLAGCPGYGYHQHAPTLKELCRLRYFGS
jgi:hypothetical protein